MITAHRPSLPKFLSTPSARRATALWPMAHPTYSISIHALREEGDSFSSWVPLQPRKFLSTPSARRATDRRSGSRGSSLISIHALREEGDRILWLWW